VAIQKLPVKFSLDRAGLVGDDGPTHHGAFDLTYLRMIPGMVVMAPRDADELRDMTHTAALHEDGPIALRFSRGAVAQAPDLSRPARALPIGKGELLREGERVCLVGIGLGTAHALEAARLLAESGIEVGVIDARFVKPLDRELLVAAARDYEWLVTVEDNALAGGFGSAVTELLADEGVQAKVARLGIPTRSSSTARPTRSACNAAIRRRPSPRASASLSPPPPTSASCAESRHRPSLWPGGRPLFLWRAKTDFFLTKRAWWPWKRAPTACSVPGTAASRASWPPATARSSLSASSRARSWPTSGPRWVYPAFYPLRPARVERPVEAVLMDLDGTSVHSEQFLGLGHRANDGAPDGRPQVFAGGRRPAVRLRPQRFRAFAILH